MNKSFLSLIIFICFLFYISFISASCSLGATPLSLDLRAKPGQEVEVSWSFYNLYGDRTTHVALNKLEGPNWEIRYEPEMHNKEYDVSGLVETITENLALETSSVVLEIPKNSSSDIDYVKHPIQKGYIPIKTVKIFITIPKNAKLWKDYNFVFESRGSCFSEPGAVIPAVATKLDVNIKTTTTFYESPVPKEPRENNNKITGGVIGADNLSLGILLFVTLLLLAVLLIMLTLKKRLKSQRKTRKLKN